MNNTQRIEGLEEDVEELQDKVTGLIELMGKLTDIVARIVRRQLR